MLNAYAQPQVIKYVDGLERCCSDAGFAGRLDIVRSDGGTMSARLHQGAPGRHRVLRALRRRGRRGLPGAARSACPNVLTLDMGGTSTDVVAVPRTARRRSSARRSSATTSSSRAAVDIHSVGAGGGSIAYLTLVGALRVGPAQRGRRPGPGLLRARRHRADGDRRQRRAAPHPAGQPKLGGTLEIDEEAAKRRRRQDRRRASASTLTPAAQAIIDIANENMHAALRVVSVERGYDPREFGLVAFGGAGPLHANALARLIGADAGRSIPATPGVLSAFGFLAADVQNEFARTYLRIAEETPGGRPARGARRALRARPASGWTREGVDEDDRDVRRSTPTAATTVQDIQIPCALRARASSTTATPRGCAAQFEGEHRRRYGFDLDAPIEIATLRVVGRAARSSSERASPTQARAGAEAPSTATSRCTSTASGTTPPIYDRDAAARRAP